MMPQLRSHCSFAGLFGLALIVQTVCGAQSAPAATEDEVFSKLDANEDGVLSGKEAAKVLPFDADKDGEVTKAEYLGGIAGEQKRLFSSDDDTLFAERDTNKDDILSGKEVKGFEKYDADSDGEVSRPEFDQGRAADRRNGRGLIIRNSVGLNLSGCKIRSDVHWNLLQSELLGGLPAGVAHDEDHFAVDDQRLPESELAK